MAGGRKAVVFLALCILICCVGGCQNDRKDVEVKVCKTSIFSWEEEYMLPDAEEEVQKAMEMLDCEAIYQQVPADTDMDVIKDYLRRRRKAGQDVYYLAGTQSGQLQKSGESMLAAVDTVADGMKRRKRTVEFFRHCVGCGTLSFGAVGHRSGHGNGTVCAERRQSV